jgi:hypothetical protein
MTRKTAGFPGTAGKAVVLYSGALNASRKTKFFLGSVEQKKKRGGPS